jgi:SAM-dependent methyltransferase
MKRIIVDFLPRVRVNSSRTYLDKFAQNAALSLPAGATVLDAGAGKGLYKHHFNEQHYESADFCQIDKAYGEITYVCDLENIPVESDKYDLVLLTQVLEHLPNPEKVLKELNRVVRPEGELWLSTPLYYEEHEIPYDFFRYTQYGLQHLLESTGFKIKQIEWLEGYFGTLSYQLAMAARSLPWGSNDYGGGFIGGVGSLIALAMKLNFAIFSIILSRFDLRYKYTQTGHCKNYTAVAVKKIA